MLAEVGARLGRSDDAEALLRRALELAPNFTAARHNLATVLLRQSRGAEAVAEAERLLGAEPGDPAFRSLHAAALNLIGEYDRAAAAYEAVLASFPQQPKAWMSYGHTLKTLGRAADSIAAYRRSLELQPKLGEAWWSLANLKTFRFTDEDLALMQAQLERPDLDEEDRFHLEFALGKALEDRHEDAAAFEHYAQANALRRRSLPYDADDTTRHVALSKAVFRPAFFAEREGWGDPAPDPIFVIGLPRSGSTLIEQILSSHSAVEGTMELPDVIAIARRLGGKRKGEDPSAYPEVLRDLTADQVRALGRDYLERTHIQRKLGRPRFIDKMPNNWRHAGLIALMLPGATIIDARRHPLGCCLSNFKQHFARGQAFSYDLNDLGRYYADYVEMMAHIDAVLPGRVHRVIYERMVEDPETEVRALLGHCGLPFEDACLRFYENERAVRTASSEQVRQPIFTEGRDHWRRFEPWLQPLKDALGPVLDAYPNTPPVPGEEGPASGR
jgi:tetratricopeptide (TPR) repeat protein